MKPAVYFILFVLSLAVIAGVAALEDYPGYMDAEYYYVLGQRLANGEGFSQPFLWNYLDDPQALPHPSHAYWMPLASILTAAGWLLQPAGGFASGRIVFLLLAAVLPPLTAWLSWTMNKREDAAWLAGLLAIFPAFYLPYLSTTDTFGIYMALGGLFFLIVERGKGAKAAFLLGAVSGLMHLARTDGILWLGVAALATLLLAYNDALAHRPALLQTLLWLAAAGAGYLFVMAPWMARNLSVFGTPLSPGGMRAFWLRTYDDLFLFPGSRLTMDYWLNGGWQEILNARKWALGVNLQTTLAVQMQIFLAPLGLIGLWRLRRTRAVRLGILTWLLTFVLMTLVFPFQGARGGFFHSGAGLQCLFWAAVPGGLDAFVEWGRKKRGWNAPQASRVFRVGLVIFSVFLTGFLVLTRVVGPDLAQPVWGSGTEVYFRIENELNKLGASPDDPVLVINPPGYYLASSRPALPIPTGGEAVIQAVSQKFSARYLLLEPDHPKELNELYEAPSDRPGLHFYKTVEGVHVFSIQPQ